MKPSSIVARHAITRTPLAVATAKGAGGAQTLHWLHSTHLGVPVGSYSSTGTATSLTNITLLGFPGQQQTLADLYYNQYRDYDPTTGRYLQADPIGLAGDVNPYVYANSNPIGFFDPLGHGFVAWRLGQSLLPLPPQARLAILAGSYTVLALIAYRCWIDAVISFPGASNDWSGSNTRGIPITWETAPTFANRRPPSDAHDPNGAKAPGKPPVGAGAGEDGLGDGFQDPAGGEEWGNANDGRGGFVDSRGNIWVPTGPGTTGRYPAHGGAHWDVQKPRGGYVNVYPPNR